MSDRIDSIDSKLGIGNVLGAGNLLVNVAQLNQLQKTHDQLERIEQGLLQESLLKELLKVYRDFVYSSNKSLEEIDNEIEIKPVKSYVRVRLIQSEYEDNEVTPDTFQEFSDKEYVEKSINHLHAVLTRAKNCLSEQQINDAELAIKYIDEMPFLTETSIAQKSKEELDHTQEDWNKLSSKHSKFTTLATISLLSLLVACPCAFFSVMGGGLIPAMFGSASGSDLGTGIGLIIGGVFTIVSVILPIALFIIGIILLTRRKSPDYTGLKAAREVFQKSLLTQDRYQQAIQLFGIHSSDEYLNMIKERQAMINSAISN